MLLDNKGVVCGIHKGAREEMGNVLEPMLDRFRRYQDQLYTTVAIASIFVICSSLAPLILMMIDYIDPGLISDFLTKRISLGCNIASVCFTVIVLILNAQGEGWARSEIIGRNVLTKMRYAACFDAEAELRGLKLVIPKIICACGKHDRRLVETMETTWEKAVFRSSA